MDTSLGIKSEREPLQKNYWQQLEGRLSGWYLTVGDRFSGDFIDGYPTKIFIFDAVEVLNLARTWKNNVVVQT